MIQAIITHKWSLERILVYIPYSYFVEIKRLFSIEPQLKQNLPNNLKRGIYIYRGNNNNNNNNVIRKEQ